MLTETKNKNPDVSMFSVTWLKFTHLHTHMPERDKEEVESKQKASVRLLSYGSEVAHITCKAFSNRIVK